MIDWIVTMMTFSSVEKIRKSPNQCFWSSESTRLPAANMVPTPLPWFVFCNQLGLFGRAAGSGTSFTSVSLSLPSNQSCTCLLIIRMVPDFSSLIGFIIMYVAVWVVGNFMLITLVELVELLIYPRRIVFGVD